jgi:hypothetical protein
MDTAWIQIFLLSVSECVAPAGKTVCQEQELHMQFVDRGECELALKQLIALKERADNVIVYKDRSHCVPTATQRPVYSSLSDVNQKFAGTPNWQAPQSSEAPSDLTKSSHVERLAALPTCDDAAGVAPCKIGDIIIEGASPQAVEVWRRDR